MIRSPNFREELENTRINYKSMDALRSAFGWSSVKDDGVEGEEGAVGGACSIKPSAGLDNLQKQFPDATPDVLDGYLRYERNEAF